jgi:hypothetical protein
MLVLATAACVAGNKLERWESPGGPVAEVEVQNVPVTGAHVYVDAEGSTTEGELLAVDAVHFWVLPDKGVTWTAVHRTTVTAVHIRLYETEPGVNAAIAGAGVVSTLLNGQLLVFTAPVWVAAGTISVVSAAQARYYGVDPAQHNLLAQFARFPEGLPPGRVQCPEHPEPGLVPPPAASGQQEEGALPVPVDMPRRSSVPPDAG